MVGHFYTNSELVFFFKIVAFSCALASRRCVLFTVYLWQIDGGVLATATCGVWRLRIQGAMVFFFQFQNTEWRMSCVLDPYLLCAVFCLGPFLKKMVQLVSQPVGQVSRVKITRDQNESGFDQPNPPVSLVGSRVATHFDRSTYVDLADFVRSTGDVKNFHLSNKKRRMKNHCINKILLEKFELLNL